MAFRADEAVRAGNELAEKFFIPSRLDVSETERNRSKEKLGDIMEQLGPAIQSYPTWHPLVNLRSSRHTAGIPDEDCGYMGLDHTRFFVNGFITCPYDDGQKVLDSVAKLPVHHLAFITAERLDVHFYHKSATPIYVKCEWSKELLSGGMIPLPLAAALLLEKEVACYTRSQVGETWESMRPYFLGSPHGSVSSLFIDQATGQALKKMWTAIINTELFGPVYN